LVKLIRDLEGMIRIGKAYTGKLELAFALVCSKRIVQIDLGLHSLLSHLPSALHILDAQFTPTVKGLLSSVKVAVNGDFRDLEIFMGEIKSYSACLIQAVKAEESGKKIVVQSPIMKREIYMENGSPQYRREEEYKCKIIDRTNSIQPRTRSAIQGSGKKSSRPRSANLDTSPYNGTSSDDESRTVHRNIKPTKLVRYASNNHNPKFLGKSPIRKIEINSKVCNENNWQCQLCKSMIAETIPSCTTCGTGRDVSGKWRCVACTAWTPNIYNVCSTCGNKRLSKHNKSVKVHQSGVKT